MKVRTGDIVLVIAGKDRGKSGTVLRVLPAEHRIVIGGINIRTRHIKKTYQEAGRKIRYESSIAASNVMLLDPKTKKPTRVGYRVDEKGEKQRIAKLSGEAIVNVKPAKIEKKKRVEKEERSAISDQQPAEMKKEKESVTTVQEAPKKSAPFWQRMKFGAAAMEQGDVEEPSRSKQDHTVPSQETHHRSAGRGS